MAQPTLLSPRYRVLLAGAGNWTFALVGLAAVPAVMLWDLVARRIGYLGSLIAAPALTGMLAEATGHYGIGLWLAGGFVALGAVLLIWLRQVDQTAQRLDAQAKEAAAG